MRFAFSALALIGLALTGSGCASEGAFAPQSERMADMTAGYEGSSGGETAPAEEANYRGAEKADDRESDGYLADRRGDDTLDIDDGEAPVRPRTKKGSKGRKKPGQTAVEPGRSSPLLIYTAHLDLAVFQVEATQKKVISLAKALGGFLSRQDGRIVVIRIPARSFETALDRIEGFGNVIRRQIDAKDVTEEFRDQTIRLRNLEAVRSRLEQLLLKADKVKDALEVQRELARVTGQIESIKGRLRFMEDRIAFSTISVNFQPTPTNDAANAAPAAFHLPFPWIEELGLRSLMDVR